MSHVHDILEKHDFLVKQSLNPSTTACPDRYDGASCAIIGYPPPDPEMRNGHNCARTRRKEEERDGQRQQK